MKSTPQAKQYSYRPEIDGIRAFAVTAVIINHFNKDILPSGYLGVDIFFVISGFVITSSLSGRPCKDFRDFLVGFYTRRIKRLVPALVLFVIVNSFLICLFNPSPEFSLKTGITSLFGLSNLYLLKQSTDYFAPSTELNVFTHTWSLGVEEQFYFLFPFVFWFTGFGRLATKGPRNLFWVMGALSVASFIAFVYSYRINQPTAYFLMPTRLWELGTGCLLFLGLKHSNRFFLTLEKIPPLIAIGAVISVLFAPSYLAWKATLAIVVFTAVLITCLRPGTTAYNLFIHPRVVYIGLISYSLYLWHWGVLSISRWTIGIHWWSVPFQIALMLLLSIASYRCVETPLRHSDWSAVRWKSIGYGIGASTIAAIGLIIFYKLIASRIYLGNILKVETPENLRATWWKNQKGEYIEKCHIEHEYKKSLLTECFQQKQVNQQTFFLIGDSHARNYLKAIQTAFPSVKTVYLTMGFGCAFLPSSLISSALEERTRCLEYTQDVATYLFQEAKKGDVVFVGQYLISSPERYTSRYANFIREFADTLRSKEVPVILLDGTAPPPTNPEFCWSTPWRLSLPSGCTK